MPKIESYLVETITDIPEVIELLDILKGIELPNHYLAGGAVTQAVWNRKLGNPPLHNVKDFDVIYFDKEHSSSESQLEEEIDKLKSFNVAVDVKNQAKVHEWYGNKFGNEIQPLKQSEDGIRMWLPCFATGVRLDGDTIKVFSPYGLEDLVNMVIRPNKLAMSKENYDSMNRSFKLRWPNIEIEAW
ncbi:MAG: nucleotidyltransferase family protein [Cycloclasticus sp.]|jgi:Uncharacterized protein conserved in bacteria